MKILFLSDNLDPKTGSGRFASSLILALNQNHKVDYLTLLIEVKKRLCQILIQYFIAINY